jgi:hypothetical protein
MATWLHDVEVYASLASGEAGPARDWGTTRLALAAPERFSVFPGDDRCHDVVLAAGPPKAAEALMEALRTRRPCPASLANATSALGVYGLLPEAQGPWITALKGALREDGDEADVWLAYALSIVGAADSRALRAAARTGAEALSWVLPVLVLRVAEKAGALEEAAKEIAADLSRTQHKNPHRLFSLLVGLGVPVPALAIGSRELDVAISYGSALAHREAPALNLPQGSQRRRQQHALRALLAEVPGPAAALLREIAGQDPHPDWALVPVCIAAWLRGRALGPLDHHHAADPIHEVLHHVGGGDPAVLSAARRTIGAEQEPVLLQVLNEGPDIAAATLAVTVLRQTESPALASGILSFHGGDIEADVRSAALACVAGFANPDAVPGLLASDDSRKRALGLLCAEFVSTSEVLTALLALPVPADPVLRTQYARDLAAMADTATVPHLQALFAGDKEGLRVEPRRLARELLKMER